MARKYISTELANGKNVNTKHTLDFVKEIAAERGGLCLSTEYQNGKAKLEFECKFGHHWPARFDSVKNANHWCPYCESSYGEKFVRQILEISIGCIFLRGRPSWLLSPLGNQMEYDGFNEERSMAFEYHGLHHIVAPHGNRKERPLELIQSRDQAKIEESNGRVTLLILHQIPEGSTQEFYIDYVLSVIKESGITPVCSDVGDIMERIKMPVDDAFIELKTKMAQQNCECLSTNYIGNRVKINARCNTCNRIWAVVPKSFMDGRGCTACKSANRHAENRAKKAEEALAVGITLKPYRKRIFKKKAK